MQLPLTEPYWQSPRLEGCTADVVTSVSPVTGRSLAVSSVCTTQACQLCSQSPWPGEHTSSQLTRGGMCCRSGMPMAALQCSAMMIRWQVQ